MPEFILRNTRCGSCVLWAASMSICSLQWMACHSSRREHSSRSRVETAFEQQDGAAPVERAQALRFGQVSSAKPSALRSA